MARPLKDIEEELLQLPLEARSQLAARLLDSIEPSDEEVQALWVEEAERRAEEMRSGKVRGEPASEVMARIRRKLA